MSWAGGDKKETLLVKVSVYTNMKRHGARKTGLWTHSSSPLKPDTCLLLVPWGLVQGCNVSAILATWF